MRNVFIFIVLLFIPVVFAQTYISDAPNFQITLLSQDPQPVEQTEGFSAGVSPTGQGLLAEDHRFIKRRIAEARGA